MRKPFRIGRRVRLARNAAAGRRYELAIALTLSTVGVVLRLLPHPANFAPVTAIAVFGGAVLPRRLAVWTPLGLMMVSDAIIGLHSLIAVTWGCYALTAMASNRWLRGPGLFRTAALTLASALFFFVVTNFAVWLTSGMYAHSWNGLSRCYVLALPFFRNSLLSDGLYTAALFTAYYLSSTAVRTMPAAGKSASISR